MSGMRPERRTCQCVLYNIFSLFFFYLDDNSLQNPLLPRFPFRYEFNIRSIIRDSKDSLAEVTFERFPNLSLLLSFILQRSFNKLVEFLLCRRTYFHTYKFYIDRDIDNKIQLNQILLLTSLTYTHAHTVAHTRNTVVQVKSQIPGACCYRGRAGVSHNFSCGANLAWEVRRPRKKAGRIVPDHDFRRDQTGRVVHVHAYPPPLPPLTDKIYEARRAICPQNGRASSESSEDGAGSSASTSRGAGGSGFGLGGGCTGGWRSVFGAVSSRELRLYECAPWSPEAWASPSITCQLIATR